MLISYEELAKATRELFRAYKYEGFTEEQAMELVKSQYAFCMINYTIKAEKRKRTDVSKLFRPPRETFTP